jgi:hypothetical protein
MQVITFYAISVFTIIKTALTRATFAFYIHHRLPHQLSNRCVPDKGEDGLGNTVATPRVARFNEISGLTRRWWY